MKKNIFLLFLLVAQIGFSQNKLSEIEKLSATCKIWGFLKYYHPEVASGKFDWRQQLFDVLPKIEKAESKEEYSLVIENWINSLGKVKKSTPKKIHDTIVFFDKNFDLSWMTENKLFSKNLSTKLKFIESNRHQGAKHYVYAIRALNISIKNENFLELKFTDKNARILSLYTYWNIIEYFFPYKYLMDKKWDVTLNEMLPLFIEAKNEDEFYLAMQKLTVRLNDSHVVFFKYNGGRNHYLPLECKIIDEKMIVTQILDSYLSDYDSIKIGDVITKVNDKSIKDIIEENRELIPASNNALYLNRLIEPTLSGSSETVKLEFLSNGKVFTKSINWSDYNLSNYALHEIITEKSKKDKFKILENNIGYVDMGEIKEKHIPDMINALEKTKAIVFDMRNYPNGTYDLISNFLNANEKPFAIYTNPFLDYPGRYFWTTPQLTGSKNKNNYKGKVIMLLNEKSASQSEWTAMCFQTAGNTTIIGSQTAGADGNVSDLEYMKGLYTRFSGIGVYYPDKSETQRIGIIPDIEIKPTIKGIQEGKDEVLDRALLFIETGK